MEPIECALAPLADCASAFVSADAVPFSLDAPPHPVKGSRLRLSLSSDEVTIGEYGQEAKRPLLPWPLSPPTKEEAQWRCRSSPGSSQKTTDCLLRWLIQEDY